jgi:hypothetical protein
MLGIYICPMTSNRNKLNFEHFKHVDFILYSTEMCHLGALYFLLRLQFISLYRELFYEKTVVPVAFCDYFSSAFSSLSDFIYRLQ